MKASKVSVQTHRAGKIIFSLILCIGLLAALAFGLHYYKYYIKNDWTIISYPSVTGGQTQFYTVTDRQGHLVIIDGGYADDAEQIKSIIANFGNHVDAWILTHPHPDHVEAFDTIMADYPNVDISIDHIYVTPVHEERYKETAKDYDNYGTYEIYSNLISQMDNVTALQAGDELDLIGLKMKVLHAWDDSVDRFENNLCNNGSLMFKLSGKEKSMLFCADTQSEVENEIIAAYGDELKADYVSCGHHGNWGLTSAFYDLVDPEVAFMDCPSSILEDESGKYDAPQLKAYFDAKGVTVYSFEGGQHSVVLK